jgi:hypothetical protein
MYRSLPSLIVAVCLLVPGIAQAGVFTFTPSPADLGDLDHSTYKTWGIAWSLPAREAIAAATLFIDDLNDWTVESGDILYMHLLDNPSLGVHSWTDNEGGGDAFAGQGVLLTTYSDTDTGSNPPHDFSYSLTASQIESLTTYLANGRFGFGFDPDCHYYNNGVTFSISTATLPEPSAGLLSLLALAALGRWRRGA